MANGTLSLPTLDPTHFTALHSLDMGSVQTPDGRDHPLDANTPVSVLQVATSATDPAIPASNTSGPGLSIMGVPLIQTPAHFGARLVVYVIAIALLLIAVWTIIKP